MVVGVLTYCALLHLLSDLKVTELSMQSGLIQLEFNKYLAKLKQMKIYISWVRVGFFVNNSISIFKNLLPKIKIKISYTEF